MIFNCKYCGQEVDRCRTVDQGFSCFTCKTEQQKQKNRERFKAMDALRPKITQADRSKRKSENTLAFLKARKNFWSDRYTRHLVDHINKYGEVGVQ